MQAYDDILIDLSGNTSTFKIKSKEIICNRVRLGVVFYDGFFGDHFNDLYKALENKGINWKDCIFISSEQFYGNYKLYVD